MKKSILILFFIPLLIFGKSLITLPFTSESLSNSEIDAIHSLFEQEFSKYDQYKTIFIAEDEINCSNTKCAKEYGEKYGSDYVLFGKINPLGEKLIVTYYLLNTIADKIEKTDQASSEKIEEMDLIVKRIVKSISTDKSFQESAELGNITLNESKENNVRNSLAYGGLGFGYLFPTKGFDNDFDRSFSLDFRSYYETEDFLVFGLAAIRKGFALNVGIAKILSKNDFSPMLGAGVGFHWISHDDDFSIGEDDKKRSDGLELLLSAGILTFRTFNFRLVLNVDYAFTFNDYNDQAITFTISLMNKGTRTCGFF